MELKFEAFKFICEWEKIEKTTDASTAEVLVKIVELLLPCLLHCENGVRKGFKLTG